MHFYVERYKSNEFIEIYRVWHDMKSKKSDLKIKKPNLSGFWGFKKPKNLGFLKWVSTALIYAQGSLTVYESVWGFY